MLVNSCSCSLLIWVMLILFVVFWYWGWDGKHYSLQLLVSENGSFHKGHYSIALIMKICCFMTFCCYLTFTQNCHIKMFTSLHYYNYMYADNMELCIESIIWPSHILTRDPNNHNRFPRLVLGGGNLQGKTPQETPITASEWTDYFKPLMIKDLTPQCDSDNHVMEYLITRPLIHSTKWTILQRNYYWRFLN